MHWQWAWEPSHTVIRHLALGRSDKSCTRASLPVANIPTRVIAVPVINPLAVDCPVLADALFGLETFHWETRVVGIVTTINAAR